MGLIDANSLSATLDAISDARFWGREIPVHERNRTAAWIASRHGAAHAYAGTFGLLDHERANGYRLFTGERVQSAAARHVAGEEACRALRWLKTTDRAARRALDSATTNLLDCLNRSEKNTESRLGKNRAPSAAACARSACGGTCWRAAWTAARNDWIAASGR